jgi:3-isopropylmalate/(R)-2-methylmalate dehydratase small subunit
VDTDQVIPARFMRCVTFDGLGEFLFHDVRFDGDGKSTGHQIDAPERKGATILVSGSNFGCGSSREHAPQALKRFGFRAIVAESFAEIFFGNCTTLGVPCVSLARADLDALTKAVTEDPTLAIALNLEKKTVRFGDRQAELTIKEGARTALINGTWDVIGELQQGRELVDRTLAENQIGV